MHGKLNLSLEELRVRTFDIVPDDGAADGAVHALCDGCSECSECTICTECTDCSVCTACTEPCTATCFLISWY